MKNILLGFIAIGLLTFVGCDKDEDTDTSNDTTDTSSDDGSTDSDTGDDGTTDDSSIKYGEGAKDIDGNTYKSVIIGEQEWVAENLRTTKYSDGTTIPNVTDVDEWIDLETAAWCHYENDSSQYKATYGKLYNWYAVETGKLCPTGWHVPTDAEWTVLTDYLASDGHIGSEGTALKATSGWNYVGNGTDDYGFLGLPGGYLYGDGGFYGIGSYGTWWSSSQHEYGENDAWTRSLYPDLDDLGRYNGIKNYGFSVRCIKD